MSSSRYASRKRRARLSVLIGVALLLTSSACGLPKTDDSPPGTVTLRFAHRFSTKHVIAKHALEVWMAEVEKRSNGRVKFEYYPGGQFVEANDVFPALRSGVIDASFFVPANAAGAELPLSDVAAVPGFGAHESLTTMQKAYWSLLSGVVGERDYLPQGVRPVMGILAGKYQVVARDSPMRSAAEWQGSAVRSAGGVSDYELSNLGASPVHMESGDVYEAMQRGTIDAGINTPEAMSSYSLNEVADSASTNAPFGAGPAVLALREDVWRQLPGDVRSAMNEARDVATASLQQAYATEIAATMEKFSSDVDFYEFPEQELARMQPAMRKAQQQWVEQREKPGKPAREVLTAWSQALQRNAAADG